VTIAKRPSVGRDGESYGSDLGQAGNEIFLQMGLDSQTTEQPVGQISRPVRRSWKSEGGRLTRLLSLVNGGLRSLLRRSDFGDRFFRGPHLSPAVVLNLEK
jgi:hypothetical protein